MLAEGFWIKKNRPSSYHNHRAAGMDTVTSYETVCWFLLHLRVGWVLSWGVSIKHTLPASLCCLLRNTAEGSTQSGKQSSQRTGTAFWVLLYLVILAGRVADTWYTMIHDDDVVTAPCVGSEWQFSGEFGLNKSDLKRNKSCLDLTSLAKLFGETCPTKSWLGGKNHNPSILFSLKSEVIKTLFNSELWSHWKN